MDIVWYGDSIYANRSHANLDRGIVLGLHELGHNVRVTNISDLQHFDPGRDDHKLIESFIRKTFESDYNVFKFPAVHLMKKGPKFNCLIHSNGQYTITRHESDIINAHPVTHFWLPTPDCAAEVDKQISIPVVGLGVDSGIDPAMFNPDIEPHDYGLADDMFKFIIACDGALPTKGRPGGGCRGTDIAINAFISEFSSRDNVCLIVKIAGNYKPVNKYITRRTFFKRNAPRIIKDYGKDPLHVTATKWRAADCMLSPIRDCRWEGCCIAALACGTPLIATDCGGPKMYGKEGVYFVPYNIADGDFYTSRGYTPIGREYWTEPSLENFALKMREVYENRESAKEFGMKGSQNIIANWKWTDQAQRIVDFFEGKLP